MKLKIQALVPCLALVPLVLGTVNPSAAPNKSPEGIFSVPLPWIIAHRGGPMMWPEETMEAYTSSTNAGNPFVEVDCRNLKDGTVILMHDGTLDRTTNHKGNIADVPMAQWSAVKVDGRKLLGDGWGLYSVPSLSEVLYRFGNKKILLVEAKDFGTQHAIVTKLKEFGISPDWVLVNSFSYNYLKPSIAAGYRAFLGLSDMKLDAKTLKRYKLWGVSIPMPVTKEYIHSLKEEGLFVVGFTTNRQCERDEQLSWGVDSIPTDDPEYLDLSQRYRRNEDAYSSQRWSPGMLAAQSGGRGYFVGGDKWAIDASKENKYLGCLQGWMCPIGGTSQAKNWSMEFSVTFRSSITPDRWASIAINTNDAAMNSDIPSAPIFGYNVLLRQNGGIEIIKYSGQRGVASPTIGQSSGSALKNGDTARYRISITPSELMVERTDRSGRLAVKDSDYRGSYVTFGAKGLVAEFAHVQLTTP